MVHQCVIKSVVMWLHILVVSLLCVYVALFGSKVKIKKNCIITFQSHY